MDREDRNSDIIVNKFTEESARDFRKKVLHRANLDPNLPITIYIDSYGGYLDSLTSMLETMEQVPNPKVTICIGKAMSCGAVLLAAGDHRFCGRRSRVMIHQGSSGAGGPIEGLQNDVDESKRINNLMMTLLAERCGKTLKQFKDEMKKKLHKDDDEARDMYLSAKDALEFGIIDQIGMPMIKPLVMYTIETVPERTYEAAHTADLGSMLAKMGATESKPKKKLKKKKVTKKKTTRKKRTRRSSGGKS